MQWSNTGLLNKDVLQLKFKKLVKTGISNIINNGVRMFVDIWMLRHLWL